MGKTMFIESYISWKEPGYNLTPHMDQDTQSFLSGSVREIQKQLDAAERNPSM